MARIKIEVTAEDIARGTQHDCRRCPVAQALARAFPRTAVFAGRHWLHIGRSECGTPLVASDFMGRYDSGVHVSPFAFDLDIPDHLLVAPEAAP